MANQCQRCLSECLKGEQALCGGCWSFLRRSLLASGGLIDRGGRACEAPKCAATRVGFQFVCPPCFTLLTLQLSASGGPIDYQRPIPYRGAVVVTAPLALQPVRCDECNGDSGAHLTSTCWTKHWENGHVFCFKPSMNALECACLSTVSYASWRAQKNSLMVPCGPCPLAPPRPVLGMSYAVIKAASSPPSTPPVPPGYYQAPLDLDVDWDLERPTPPMAKPRRRVPSCTACGVEMCPGLDDYYGKDVRGKTACSPCRKRLGIP